jgi:TolB-like protein/DNA-binding SARP family transcriptional activator
MLALVLDLLGGFELRPRGGPPLDLSTKTGQALLAYLALAPGQRHSRDKLAAVLWEDRPDQQARTSLRQTLAVVRKALRPFDGSWLDADGDWISIDRGALEIDVVKFERLASLTNAESLTQAAALYKGELLQGFNLRGEGFGEWLRTERERLFGRAVQVLGKLLAMQSDGGEIEAAIATANRLLSLDPLNEGAHRSLMRLHVAQGRQELALRQYEICRDRLRRELNVDPDPTTAALHQEILARRFGARPANLAAPFSPAPLAGTAPAADAHRRDRPSIVILPFVNQGGALGQDYLSDGITEDIITELSRYRSLLVIARSSSFQFKGPAVDIAAVRQKLGVQYLVEGSVRKIGANIRVSAQLIDADSEGHLWAERYDRPAEEIFGVQDEVASAIAATLEGRIVATGVELAKRKPTKDWRAYDHFLQGRELMHRYRTIEAERCFDCAIALDPDYAHAHAWRSLALTGKYVIEGKQRLADLENGFADAQHALALGDADAWSHQAMGFALMWRGQLDLAGAHFDRAISLNPNDVSIACDRANFLLCADRLDEALRSLDAALQRDPFPPMWAWEVRGSILYGLKRYEEAIAAYRKVDTGYFWMPAFLAACYAQAGQVEDAKQALAEFLKIKPGVTVRNLDNILLSTWGNWRSHVLDGLRKAGLPE